MHVTFLHKTQDKLNELTSKIDKIHDMSNRSNVAGSLVHRAWIQKNNNNNDFLKNVNELSGFHLKSYMSYFWNRYVSTERG